MFHLLQLKVKWIFSVIQVKVNYSTNYSQFIISQYIFFKFRIIARCTKRLLKNIHSFNNFSFVFTKLVIIFNLGMLSLLYYSDLYSILIMLSYFVSFNEVVTIHKLYHILQLIIARIMNCRNRLIIICVATLNLN